ncbi:hypothetical protein IM538_10965 [Cytobacillus suaedae]|nr:hypothetical protein IM538_10965 [Cytobacillus suaedae]
MSLKLIELQVALPRTQDMGKVQEQVNQRSQLQQDLLVNAAQQEEEKKRKQVTKNDELGKTSTGNKKSFGQTTQNKENKNNEKLQDELKEQHPYKGNIVDFVG